MALELLSWYKTNPNIELAKVSGEIDRVNRKLEPLMNQVSQVVFNAGFTEWLWDKANAIGMISKISGRFISFYADDLA